MKRTIAEAFNEWMRRYTENPEQFQYEFRTINQFLKEKELGQAEPSYGQECALYLELLQKGDEVDALVPDAPRAKG